MSDAILRQKLQLGLHRYHLESHLAEPLLQYLTLLQKWNHTYNLTAIHDIETMISRHVLDSLAIIPWVQGPKVIDVGSGAGLPGIPLAITQPHLQLVLLDSNGKKTRFLSTVKRTLALNNIEVIQSRVESYHPTTGFDTVVSRAFSRLSQMVTWTEHLIAPNGIWLAMKGMPSEDELRELVHPYRVEQYNDMELKATRSCVIIQP